jgi:uncharacterized protein YggE
MNKRNLIVAGLVFTLMLFGLTGCEQSTASGSELADVNIDNQQQGIWVTGEGEVTAIPDIATLRLGIEAQDSTVVAARDSAATAMNNVINSLTSNGVAQEDIQTEYFNIQQVTRWNNDTQTQDVIGYQVSNIVNVKVRNLENTGMLIDAVVSAGGDLTRVNSIDFSIEDPSSYYQEARKAAVTDARDTAEQLADYSGVKLGNVIYISEGTSNQPIVQRSGAIAATDVSAVETPISTGQLTISTSVQICYSIE